MTSPNRLIFNTCIKGVCGSTKGKGDSFGSLQSLNVGPMPPCACKDTCAKRGANGVTTTEREGQMCACQFGMSSITPATGFMSIIITPSPKIGKITKIMMRLSNLHNEL